MLKLYGVAVVMGSFFACSGPWCGSVQTMVDLRDPPDHIEPPDLSGFEGTRRVQATWADGETIEVSVQVSLERERAIRNVWLMEGDVRQPECAEESWDIPANLTVRFGDGPAIEHHVEHNSELIPGSGWSHGFGIPLTADDVPRTDWLVDQWGGGDLSLSIAWGEDGTISGRLTALGAQPAAHTGDTAVDTSEFERTGQVLTF